MSWVRIERENSNYLIKEEYINSLDLNSNCFLYEKYLFNDNDVEIEYYKKIISKEEKEKLLFEGNWKKIEINNWQKSIKII